MRDARLELSAANAREPRIAYAVIVAVEPAKIERPVLAQRTVDVEIVAREAARGARRLERAAHFGAAGLVNEIDDRARRVGPEQRRAAAAHDLHVIEDRKSTRLNSSHQIISYAVFC